MPLTRGFRELVDDAMAVVRTISPAEAHAKLGDPNVLVIDLRDPRELDREGMVEGAMSITRGMLEFWVDPASPYYKPILGEGREMVLYCGGGWRSALAAQSLQSMGFTTDEVCHVDGGFAAWKTAGLPTVERPKK